MKKVIENPIDASKGHDLVRVESEPATDRCRYVCACGAKGRFVRSLLPESMSADTWAHSAHGWHVALATDPTRPADWDVA